ncbi:hypothetical protein BKA69DRAFT_933681 [Paraphysoderma sedebokerense]|nr:hypothetical protein BKA69DRAFT_933681 [Paraphysoderma sedebokerense]
MPCVQSRFFSSAPMLLFVLYFLLVFNNSLVSSISFPWYITEYITTGIPSSENWFPNDTEIVDTVVAPNGSVYVLDSNRSLYKFNGYSYSVQKTQLTPPGSPVSSWYGADFDQLFRLWIHPESYDPYLFRLRWSNISAAEDVMCEIVWYTDVDFGNSTTSLPQNVSFSTHIPVTNVSGINRYLDLGREFGLRPPFSLPTINRTPSI